MITLNQAQAIIAGALDAAHTHAIKPLAIVVLDAGGHILASVRQDNASLFRHDIARAKAMGALGMGSDTAVLAQRAAANPAFFLALVGVTGGNIVYSPGGVLIRDASGTLIGAVGISGDSGENDELCALAGIKQAIA
jgi:uncharacterized protein GlcG (DUF336 family)